MLYDAIVTIVVPAALAATASAVGRAMDPDVGGAQSFRHPVTGYANDGSLIFDLTELTCTTACTSTFQAAALQMLADATGRALYAYVSADYSTRWPGLTPPTLSDCAAFCQAVTINP
jgi:hypothetical protein